MISWADPDLISKQEWDREYAQPIMAGAPRFWYQAVHVCRLESLVVSVLQKASRPRMCTAHRGGRAFCGSAYQLVSGKLQHWGSKLQPARSHLCVPAATIAGQLPDASSVEIRTMNKRLAVFHDLTSGQANKGFQQAAFWELMLAALLDCCDALRPTCLPSRLCFTAVTPPAIVRSCRVVHRCGEEILKRELPPKHEVVLKLALTPTQQKVYERFIQVRPAGASQPPLRSARVAARLLIFHGTLAVCNMAL